MNTIYASQGNVNASMVKFLIIDIDIIAIALSAITP